MRKNSPAAGKALDDMDTGKKASTQCSVPSVGGRTTGSRPATAPSPRPGWRPSRALARRQLVGFHPPITTPSFAANR